MRKFYDAAHAVSSLGNEWRDRGFKLWFERYDNGAMFSLFLTHLNKEPTPYISRKVLKSPPYPSVDEIVSLNSELEFSVFGGTGHG